MSPIINYILPELRNQDLWSSYSRVLWSIYVYRYKLCGMAYLPPCKASCYFAFGNDAGELHRRGAALCSESQFLRSISGGREGPLQLAVSAKGSLSSIVMGFLPLALSLPRINQLGRASVAVSDLALCGRPWELSDAAHSLNVDPASPGRNRRMPAILHTHRCRASCHTERQVRAKWCLTRPDARHRAETLAAAALLVGEGDIKGCIMVAERPYEGTYLQVGMLFGGATILHFGQLLNGRRGRLSCRE